MADEDLKELLKNNLEVSEKSLEILKKMHRETVYRRVFTVLKWLVIIALLVWGFVQLQPFIDQLTRTINQVNRFLPGR